MSCFLHHLQTTNVMYVLLFAVHLASALIKRGALMWNDGNTSQGPSYNVAVKNWKTGDGTICVTNREESLSCGWSLCVHEHGQRATEMLPQFLTMYRTASNSQTSVFGLLTLHPCSDKSGCDHVACVLVSPLSCHCTDHSQLSHTLSFTVLSCPITPLHMYCFLLLCCSWPKFLHLQLTAFRSNNDDPPSPTISMEWASLATVHCTVHFQEVSVFYYK
jgi:hypothetical protein